MTTDCKISITRQLRIVGENMQFLGGKPDPSPGGQRSSSTGYGGQRTNSAPATRPTNQRPDQNPNNMGYTADEDDSIPF